MSRDALVVGINTYESEQLISLKAPAEDAEAVAKLLSQCGDFRVRRLPEVKDKENNSVRVGRKTKVALTQLEEALVQLFKPTGTNIPDTALFYFSGHGLRKDLGIQEGFLATSDVNPHLSNWGLRLKWLRELLQESPIRQQIVWLDCCYSGELLNFNDADPGDRGKGRDRCFIAASREYEVAYEETAGNHGILTAALLQGLNPRRQPTGAVDNLTLVDFINQRLRGATQRPIQVNSGDKILLTGRGAEAINPIQGGICPYRGLAYFDWNSEDPKYFYGRTALTDQLLEKIRQGNFVAVLGASGCGKSSVVRAGLLHQLQLGQKLGGSNQWNIKIFRPGEHPSRSLAYAFVNPGLSEIDQAKQAMKAEELIAAGTVGLSKIIQAFKANRVVLVVDQFEEVFTLCKDNTERQRFFECLLNTAERLGNVLTLVITMRADFYGKCTEKEYAGLTDKIQANLVTVSPMKEGELEQAIIEPARQVGLEIEQELVTQIIEDVEGSPGSLPLMQYTLTELWKQRVVNRLTLSAYKRLGGVKGTLQKRATEVYEKLQAEEQQTAKRIFLALTQLGEGTEDTRRQVYKQDLVTAQESVSTVDLVLQKLTDAKLIVTNELVARNREAERVAVVDIAHEALIRHWTLLQTWISENRDALVTKRVIEIASQEWFDQGKPEDELAYLLQGPKLGNAEEFIEKYANAVGLSNTGQEFVRVSQAKRDDLLRQKERLLQEEKERDQRERDQLKQLLEQEEKARQAESRALEKEKEARKADQRRNYVITGALSIVLITGGIAGWFSWQQQQQSQKALQVFKDQALGIEVGTPEIIRILEDSLNEARTLEKKGGKETERAIAYYRKIRIEAKKLGIELEEHPEKFQSNEERDIKHLSENSEKFLIQVIRNYRMPVLEAQLNPNNPTIGEKKKPLLIQI